MWSCPISGVLHSLTPFHLVGDWNDEPNEAPLAMSMEGAGARVVATEQPIPMEGIDAAWTT